MNLERTIDRELRRRFLLRLVAVVVGIVALFALMAWIVYLLAWDGKGQPLTIHINLFSAGAGLSLIALIAALAAAAGRFLGLAEKSDKDDSD